MSIRHSVACKMKTEPLQTSFHEGGWESSVVTIENHIHRRECTKSGFLVFGDLRGNDPGPEWIKCSSGENITSAVGVKDKIIKCELIIHMLVTEYTK